LDIIVGAVLATAGVPLAVGLVEFASVLSADTPLTPSASTLIVVRQYPIVRGYFLTPGVGAAECRAAAERWAAQGEASWLHHHAHGEPCNDRCELVAPKAGT
jgi:hypothetical protein